MSRKDFKHNAKKNLFKNYFASIFVCLVMLLVVGSYSSTRSTLITDINYVNDKLNLIDTSQEDLAKRYNTEDGIFKFVFDGISKTQRYVKHASNALDDFIDGNNIDGFLVIISLMITSIINIFIFSILKVGENRFFMESRRYHKTNILRLFYGFKRKKYFNLVKVSFIKFIYQLLWSFTIIGGIIKYYSYYLVNFILAENPNINPKDAIKLSRDMMNGYKFKTLIFDISFLGWEILNGFFFGLTGILFLNPYYKLSQVELYTYLKNKAKKENILNSNLLNDNYLDVIFDGDYYPGCKKFEISVKKDYYKKYSLMSYILFFFAFSFVGWIWEVILIMIKDGNIVNRGALHGPWLPIYGSGCICVLLLLIPKKFKKILDNPIYTLFFIMFICSFIEYFTSVYLEVFKCLKYWDYTGFFLNINGRICLEGTVFFGLGGCLCIYIVAPYLDKLFRRVSKNKLFIICSILLIIFTLDFIYSSKYPNYGHGITENKYIINSKYCKN